MKLFLLLFLAYTTTLFANVSTHVGLPEFSYNFKSESFCKVEIQRDVEYEGHIYAKYVGPYVMTSLQRNTKNFGKPVLRSGYVDISSLMQRLEVQIQITPRQLHLQYLSHNKVIAELIITYNILAELDSVYIRKDQFLADTNETQRLEAKCVIPVSLQ